MPSVTPPLDVSVEELEGLLERARDALGEAGYQKLKAAIRTLSYVTELLENREATLESLRRLLCRARSEKTEAVLEEAGIAPSPTSKTPPADAGSKKAAAGHGRNGAKAYPVLSASKCCMPRCIAGSDARVSARQSLPAAGAGAAGAVARPGADHSESRRNKPSRYSSPDASTPARTWPMYSAAAPPNWLLRCRCAMRSRATCPSCRRNWKSSRAIVSRTLAAVLWR